MARKETPPGLAKKGRLPPKQTKKGTIPVIELRDFYWDDGLINPIVEIPSLHHLTLSVGNPTDENFLYSVEIISEAFPSIRANMKPHKADSVAQTFSIQVGDSRTMPGKYPIRLVATESHTNTIVADQIVGDITLQAAAPPPPELECRPGETVCKGFDLYRCTDEGVWVVSPYAPSCGYVPPLPPEPDIPLPPTPPPPEPLPPLPIDEGPLPVEPTPSNGGSYWEEPEGNLQICYEGQMACDGYDLYICKDGVMAIAEQNSLTCGYPREEQEQVELEVSPWEEYKVPILIGGASIGGALLIAAFKSLARSK